MKEQVSAGNSAPGGGTSPAFSITAEQMAAYVNGLGQFGALEDGSIHRDVYDGAWLEARKWLQEQMEEAGLAVHTDAVGNLFGRIQGREDGTILTGSHLDTVSRGGRFDGALGILAGLAALRAIKQLDKLPRKSLEVVALCEEEGGRFYGDFLGSRAVWGRVEVQELDELRDARGITLRQAMELADGLPGEIRAAERTDIESFIELHIEQGPVLEKAKRKVGLVSDITGLCVQTVRVSGQADHAGTTPMEYRKDALVGVSEMILAARRIALDLGAPTVATVGHLTVESGAVNVVPETVSFSLDARHPDPARLDAVTARLGEAWMEIAGKYDLQLEIKTVQRTPGTQLDPDLTAVLAAAADLNGVETVNLTSGAGHDSQIMAQHVPTAMLFVPSVGGRSHSKDEFTSFEDCATGSKVLASALHALAY